MERVEKQNVDYILLLLLILLLGVGVAVLYSASYPQAERLGKNPYFFFTKQLILIGLGVILAFIASCTPLSMFQKAVPIILLISFFLLLLTLLPGLGLPVMGARRWIIAFGLSFQPSELAKVALVLYLAAYFSKKEGRLDDPIKSILPPLIVVTFFVGLILIQNDFSTALFLFFIALLLFYIAHVRLLYFLLLGFIVLPLGMIFLFSKEHRVQRLISFLDPGKDPTGSGFQVIQAKLALATGGLWGKGLGMGMKKFGSLPEAHSDFIFAIVGEELGFLGVMFVIFLFLLLAYRGYMIALRSKDSFSSYLAFGITTTITCQTLLNMAVVSGLVPATGVPLPFFSSGGSSIVMTLVMGGLLLNVSRKVPMIGQSKIALASSVTGERMGYG